MTVIIKAEHGVEIPRMFFETLEKARAMPRALRDFLGIELPWWADACCWRGLPHVNEIKLIIHEKAIADVLPSNLAREIYAVRDAIWAHVLQDSGFRLPVGDNKCLDLSLQFNDNGDLCLEEERHGTETNCP